jgi:hypothetical protein
MSGPRLGQKRARIGTYKWTKIWNRAVQDWDRSAEYPKIGTVAEQDWDMSGLRFGMEQAKIVTAADQIRVWSSPGLGKERSKIKKGSKDPKIGTEMDEDWDWSSPRLGQERTMIGKGSPQDWDRSRL